jgi:hypothetical protein
LGLPGVPLLTWDRRASGPESAAMLNLIKEFLSSVANSSKGFLNAEELYRSIVTALGSGSFLGLVLTIFQSLLANAATIFPNPIVSALATMLLTLIVDLLRRLNQGGKPNPTPASTALQA